jgi:curved DNA-binding protein CbpA
MTLVDYYKILDLSENASIEEIKIAYRKKARLYHPDINHAPDAKDLFISATEAYEFLISNHDKISTDEKAYHQAMDDWRKYRQDRSHRRAHAYARASFRTFKGSNFYKSTKIFDVSTIIITFASSIMILVFSILGYIYRLQNPIPGLEKPSVISFILILLLGLSFLAGSFIFFKAYQASVRKHRMKH